MNISSKLLELEGVCPGLHIQEHDRAWHWLASARVPSLQLTPRRATASRTSSNGTSKTKWLTVGRWIPAALSQWGHTPTKHPSKLPAQSESASSTTDPHVLPLFSQVSNKFLLWPKSVSFFLDKYQLSECFLIWNCSHRDRPLLQMRWGQPEPTTAV